MTEFNLVGVMICANGIVLILMILAWLLEEAGQ
jgi:hypothetical protein